LCKDKELVIGFKLEDLFCPIALDDSEFLVDFELLLSYVDYFFHFGFELMEFELEDLVEGEEGGFVIDVRACFILQLLPMSIFHIVASQTFN
jgi:hypothetical protein